MKGEGSAGLGGLIQSAQTGRTLTFHDLVLNWRTGEEKVDLTYSIA